MELAGVYLPEPFTGWKAMKAGLLTSTYLELEHVHQTKASYSSVVATQEMVDEVERLGEEGNVFDRLAASIAPEIYGMLDVKKVGKGTLRGKAKGLGYLHVSSSSPDDFPSRSDEHMPQSRATCLGVAPACKLTRNVEQLEK